MPFPCQWCGNVWCKSRDVAINWEINKGWCGVIIVWLCDLSCGCLLSHLTVCFSLPNQKQRPRAYIHWHSQGQLTSHSKELIEPTLDEHTKNLDHDIKNNHPSGFCCGNILSQSGYDWMANNKLFQCNSRCYCTWAVIQKKNRVWLLISHLLFHITQQ